MSAIRHETNGAPQASLSIEMVLPSLATGGMEMMTRDLALGLAARRHRVGITCLEGEGELAAALRDSGVSVSLVACPGVRPNFFPHPKLSAHVAARGCHVVHAHNGVWAKAALASCSVRVPAMVSTLHGFAYGEGWHSEPLRWWGALHSDVVVAVSAPLRRHLVQRTRIPTSKVTVLANGIDTARFAPGRRSGTIRSRFGIAPGVPLIGCVARLDPIKNHALLLASLKLVLQSLPHTRLLLAGEGPLRLQLGALVAEMGLSQSVIFAGALADTAPLYRDLDVFVLPSLSEGTSISVLEAMASGVPVVATAVGGTPDLLAGGACGLLVPSGDAAAMASAVIRLFQDGELRTQLAANARERVTSTFSQLAMVIAYEALYHSILRTKHERSSAR